MSSSAAPKVGILPLPPVTPPHLSKSDSVLYSLILSHVSSSAAPLPCEVSKWMASASASIPKKPFLPPASFTTPPPPPLLLSPFDSLPDDIVCVVATFIDVPDILSFALISSQFNSCVVDGFFFQSLALNRFPLIDKLYSTLPCAKKSYREMLRQQVAAMGRKKVTGSIDSLKRNLQEDYSYFISFDLTTGNNGLTLRGKERKDIIVGLKKVKLTAGPKFDNILRAIIDDPMRLKDKKSGFQIDKLTSATYRKLLAYLGVPTGVRVKQDVMIVQPEWQRMVAPNNTMRLMLKFPETVVEFPLWPKMEEYGSPDEDGFEEEKKRRQSFRLNKETLMGQDIGSRYFLRFSIFVVKRDSGETAKLLSSSEFHFSDDYFAGGKLVHQLVHFNKVPFGRSGFCSECDFGSAVVPFAKLRSRLVEGVGEVPQLVCKVDEVWADFCDNLGQNSDDVPSSLSTVLDGLQNLFH